MRTLDIQIMDFQMKVPSLDSKIVVRSTASAHAHLVKYSTITITNFNYPLVTRKAEDVDSHYSNGAEMVSNDHV